ncbi:M1 family metallopeptidase [Urechidicola vernalis]|uniref:Aminopeptidase N n=1 Tax=Urechidicola vernalis TaxID=3075600 RepID=A0ABU2Y2P3_9FLAO|nr:M1 family metallopeptidase [Urechidicola sp. P050]MDT0551909.1 M1 family metallopeptidase [Urechidicola sp. P050]
MRIKNLVILLFLSFSLCSYSQTNRYRAERQKINNLVHTKLNISFDIPKSLLMGEAWISAKPHFNPTSKLTLDAKSMHIHSVQMNGKDLEYNYFESRELIVELDREYAKDEEFTIYINYTARPEKFANEDKDKNDIRKGIYFIDPKGQDPNTPTQIWTEGETESNSVWFPTIDAPNQKTSQEINITIPNKYVSLSNGTLINQVENSDGTRTDYWKQDQKHAPYLVFMGIGEFAIVKEKWKGKPIEYYVEKEYEDVAKEIFGQTPEMLSFYEELLDVEYPWDKYSQIVVREYISGAMENTTAVTHDKSAYQEKGELIDENIWEATIAHEIFHHWFGNIVTAESWSNLALNEAFANYGEYLWFEHAYGKDYANEMLLRNREVYFDKEKNHKDKDLVRFQYADRDDMFDAVSYEKGGMILHMLRNYLGDDQFFAGLTKYLSDFKFRTAEIHDLRLVFEEISGKDLNWFFNQWFLGNGHPELLVMHEVGGFNNKVTVNISQAGKVFEFPLTIEVYESNGQKSSYDVWVNNKYSSFSFSTSDKPSLVLVNPKGALLAEIAHAKSLEEAVFQFNNSKDYVARKEALEIVIKQQEEKVAFKTVTKALNDDSHHLRILALENINFINKHLKGGEIEKVQQIAKNDSNTLVQAAAITTLAKLVEPSYLNYFLEMMESESYAIIESGIVGVYHLNKELAIEKADELPEKVKDNMSALLTGYYLEKKEEKHMPFIAKHLMRGIFFIQDAKIADTYKEAFEWIARSNNLEAITNVVDGFVAIGRQYKEEGGDQASINFLRQMQYLQKEENHSNRKELENIIRIGMSKLVN